ncbi:RNA-directed DNA polymerase [Tanacetum coccineum]
MCLESWGKSNYARILIKINASNDFSDNLVMAVLNLKGTGYTKETIRVEYKMAKGKGGSSKADDDGFIKVKKKKLCGDGTFSLSNSFEALNVENPVIKELLERKCVLVEDDGKLRETVECSGDQGREDEVEYVENEMASYLALRPSRVEYDTKSLSSYARVMIELRADVELKENIVVVMPKINEEEFHTFNMHVEYEWKPLRCACCKIFGHTQVECPKNLDLHAGAGETRKKKPSKAPKDRESRNLTSSTGTTPIMDKIWKFENLVIDGQAILVDEAGNPLKKVEYPGDHDSEDEVASVDNDMARSLASEKAGFVTQSLLEQWRDSYSNGDYDEDSYDDDMYEGQDLSEEIQTLCEKLDIRVREDQPRGRRGREGGYALRVLRNLSRLPQMRKNHDQTARLEDDRDDEESGGTDTGKKIASSSANPTQNSSTSTYNPNSSRGGGSLTSKRCYKFQGLGHFANDCPNKKMVTFVEERWPVPWQFDLKTKHDGFKNTYTFQKDLVTVILGPFDLQKETKNQILSRVEFMAEIPESFDVFALVVVESNQEDFHVPSQVISILEEFADVVPQELPSGLPPIRDI